MREALVSGSALEIGAGVRYFTKLMREWRYEVTDADLVVGDRLDISSQRLRDEKKTRHSCRYSVLDYVEVLGNPVTVTSCEYLSMLEWDVRREE